MAQARISKTVRAAIIKQFKRGASMAYVAAVYDISIKRVEEVICDSMIEQDRALMIKSQDCDEGPSLPLNAASREVVKAVLQVRAPDDSESEPCQWCTSNTNAVRFEVNGYQVCAECNTRWHSEQARDPKFRND